MLLPKHLYKSTSIQVCPYLYSSKVALHLFLAVVHMAGQCTPRVKKKKSPLFLGTTLGNVDRF